MFMVDRKAQISMNVIVYVAIALLVLVLIVAFTTGGLGNLFRGLTTTGPGELETIKNKCITNCENAKSQLELTGTSSWISSTYCAEKYGYDSNSDGTTESDEFFNCWEQPIGITCSTTVSTTGGVWSQESCETGFAEQESEEQESEE